MSLLYFPCNKRQVLYKTIVSLFSVTAVYRQNRKGFSQRTKHLGTVVQWQPPLPPTGVSFFPQYTIIVILFKSECLGLDFWKPFVLGDSTQSCQREEAELMCWWWDGLSLAKHSPTSESLAHRIADSWAGILALLGHCHLGAPEETSILVAPSILIYSS